MGPLRSAYLSALATLIGDAAAAGHVGDYIAAGLGLHPQAVTASSSTQATPTLPTLYAHWNGSTTRSSILSLPSHPDPAPTPPYPGSHTVSTTPPHLGHSFGNGSHIPLNDSCWQQWEDFYSIWEQHETVYTTVVPTTIAVPSVVDGTTLYYVASDATFATVTMFDGAHPIETHIVPTTVYLSVPVPAWFDTETITETKTTSVFTASAEQFTSPVCALPTSVPGCQSSWDKYQSEYWEHFSTVVWPECAPRWIEDELGSTVHRNPGCWNAWTSFYHAGLQSTSAVGPRPLCSQASLPASYCSSEASRIISWGSKLIGVATDNGWTTSAGLNGSIATYWAADRSLAPGCTMGCQQCKLTGASVRMFYWPPNTAVLDPDSPPVTALGMGTTFTSPTVYISFDTIFASDSCSAVGNTYYNTILAIPQSRDISSLWGMNYINGFQYTAPFNFSDLLQTPVPNSIYNRQPRCALAWFEADAHHPLDLYNCSRNYPYNPILMMPDEARNIDPAWADCGGGIQGVYDPPIALQPSQAIALPTAPAEITYGVPASPASKPHHPPIQTFSYDPQPTRSHSQHFVFDPIEDGNPATREGGQMSFGAATPTRGDSQPATNLADPLSGIFDNLLPEHHPVSAAIIKVGSQAVTAIMDNPTGAVRIGEHTLHPGQVVTLDGQTISAAPLGILVDGNFATFQHVQPPPDHSVAEVESALITIDNDILTAVQSNNVIAVDSHEFSQGASTIIDGHTFRVGPSGLVVDGQAVQMTPASQTQSFVATAAALIGLGSATVTAIAMPSNRILINGKPLSIGQTVTSEGHIFVAHTDGVVLDGSATISLPAGRESSMMLFSFDPSGTFSGVPHVTNHVNIEGTATAVPSAVWTASAKSNNGLLRIEGALMCALIAMVVAL